MRHSFQMDGHLKTSTTMKLVIASEINTQNLTKGVLQLIHQLHLYNHLQTLKIQKGHSMYLISVSLSTISS
jgi:hypothetical protein